MEGLTPQDVHNISQASATIKEHLIPVFRSFFEGCIENKFTKVEALHLTTAFMLNMLNTGREEKSAE